MAVSDRKVSVAECDACGARKYTEEGEVLVGVVGHVQHVDDKRVERNVEFFSCKADAGHIGKAAAKALEAWKPEFSQPTSVHQWQQHAAG